MRTHTIGNRWREIQGSNDWVGLVDPLDETLAKELLRLGNLQLAAYHGFNQLDELFKPELSDEDRRKVEEKVESKLNLDGYEVIRHLYIDSEKNSWFGFVAVSTCVRKIDQLGRRDILIVLRGTQTLHEWLNNFQYYMVGDPEDKLCGVSLGFWSLFKTQLADDVHNGVKEAVTKYKHEQDLSITFVGHSLGGALAVLCASDIATEVTNWYSPSASGKNVIPVTVFTFGSPKLGNDVFRNKLKTLRVAVLRVVNKHDLMPKFLFAPVVRGVKNTAKELRGRLQSSHFVNKSVRLKRMVDKYSRLPKWPPGEHGIFVQVGVKVRIGNSTTSPSRLNPVETVKFYLDSHKLLEGYIQDLEIIVRN